MGSADLDTSRRCLGSGVLNRRYCGGGTARAGHLATTTGPPLRQERIFLRRSEDR